MSEYVTGVLIKKCRESKHITQQALADSLKVSVKTISKWETGRGYPDISLLEPLANVLGLSLIELLSGNNVTNYNRSSNLLKSKFYVCPICGNVVASVGEVVVSCCGIVLHALELEEIDVKHKAKVDIVEDEYYVTFNHEMSKQHYISFIAAIGDNKVNIVKLYPEEDASARFKIDGIRRVYYYCNHHGLYCQEINKKKDNENVI